MSNQHFHASTGQDRTLMTEKEKRDAGELYYAGKDSNFLDEVIKAKDLCYEYNQIRPTDFKAQREILEKLLGKIGEDSVIYPPFWCDYGYNIEMGKGCLANHGLTILDGAKVSFGDNVLIGPGCYFHTAGHPIDPDLRKQWLVFTKPITVGNNVWFGAGVHVLPGVTIGDNAVIGAGSIVTKDIPADCVAVGNPCKVVKKVK
jgi:acetyltransferase-like isoleucine patch superfamily enzyme